MQLRQRLARDGFTEELVLDALACASVACERALQLTPTAHQHLAAACMLNQNLVELPTGEGKTVSLILAATVSGLADMPTHVLTANDHLAERDAVQCAACVATLGLRVAYTTPGEDADRRRGVHEADIVYTTARELAFDVLRDDHTDEGRRRPRLRGLCNALLDEADALLLDEAELPLILSGPAGPCEPERRALWWQAWQLGGMLQLGLHAHVDTRQLHAHVTLDGQMQLEHQCARLGGVWRRPLIRTRLVEMALVARHALVEGRHFVCQARQVTLLDSVTGRQAPGRALGQGLQALLQIRCGVPVTRPADVVARSTVQHVLQRFWRLGGISATLREDRSRLFALHGLDVTVLHAHRPSQLQRAAPMVADDRGRLHQALVARVTDVHRSGRPILIGLDDVGAAQALSDVLHRAGLPHQMLHAGHEADEADRVMRAGQCGTITLTTRMAGRGTDIRPSAEALAAGGLHLIACLQHESPRHERQFLGRTARAGAPGSAETWICPAISAELSEGAPPILPESPSERPRPIDVRCTNWSHTLRIRVGQWLDGQRRQVRRQRLMEQEQQWVAHHFRSRRSRR